MTPHRAAHHEPPQRPCPLERYLEAMSGAWVPRILWCLLERPHRFGELRRSINGVSPKVLTSKLRALEQHRLVLRRVSPSSPPRVTYSLTKRGRALEPVFRAMEKAADLLFSDTRGLKADKPAVRGIARRSGAASEGRNRVQLRGTTTS